MAEFTANVGTDTGFAPPNALFNPAQAIQAAQTIQSNQLGLQGKQIDLANAGMEQVGRAAAGLLSAYPDEASRAAAYPKVVGMLQAQGFAKNAPPTYPGEGVLRSLVNQSIPAKDLYSSGALMTPAQQVLLGRAANQTPPRQRQGPQGPRRQRLGGRAPFVGANLPAGVSADEDQLVRTVYGEAGGEPVAGQQAVAHVIKTRMKLGNQGVGDVVFAPNQFEAWSDPKNRPRMEALGPTDPQYQAILNNVVRPVISGQAQDPTGGATTSTTRRSRLNSDARRLGSRRQPNHDRQPHVLLRRLSPHEAPRRPPTAPTGGVAARTGGTDTAGPGARPHSGAWRAASRSAAHLPPARSGAPRCTGRRPLCRWQLGPPPPGHDARGSRSPISNRHSQASQHSHSPTTAPTAPPAPAAAPASTSRLPEASTIPIGQNSAPYKQAMQLQQQAMQYDAVGGTNPAFAKHAADLRLQAAGILQAGATVSAQQNGREGELEVVTGKFTPYAPLPSPRGMQGTAAAWDGTKSVTRPTPENQANAVRERGLSPGAGRSSIPTALRPFSGKKRPRLRAPLLARRRPRCCPP